MGQRLWLRMAAGLGIVVLAILFLSMLPVLSEISNADAQRGAEPFGVNRALKGDLLPLIPVAQSGVRTERPDAGQKIGGSRQQGTQPSERLPVGCDPAFSPISSPHLAKVFGRCMT